MKKLAVAIFAAMIADSAAAVVPSAGGCTGKTAFTPCWDCAKDKGKDFTSMSTAQLRAQGVDVPLEPPRCYELPNKVVWTEVDKSNVYVNLNLNGGRATERIDLRRIPCPAGEPCHFNILPSQRIVRDGYDFMGWGESATGAPRGSYRFDYDDYKGKEVNLWAIWRPKEKESPQPDTTQTDTTQTDTARNDAADKTPETPKTPQTPPPPVTPPPPPPPPRTEAQIAWDDLRGFTFNADDWQSADGRGFNWTRFGLDAAGAVGGATLAGLLTHDLVTKDQLKKGYANIQCVTTSGNTFRFAEPFTVR